MKRIGEISILQKRRLEEVLYLGLEEQIRVIDTEAIAPIPSRDDYWLTTGGDVEQIFGYTDCIVAIGQETPTEYLLNLTGTKDRDSSICQTNYRITLLFKQLATTEEITFQERKMRPLEIVDLMADIYRGAIIEIIDRDAVDGCVITEADIVSDFADTITIDNIGVTGRAVITISVRTQVERSTPAYNVARQL